MCKFMSEIEIIREKFKVWRNDWNKFAFECLKVKLDKNQEEILHAVQHNNRISVCSGTAMGKDFLAATASMCFLYLTPFIDSDGILQTATVINTAPSDRQVKNIMMREIKSRYNGSILPKLKKIGYDTGRTVMDGIKFSVPENMIGQKKYANIDKWYMLAFKGDDSNTEVWTGFHNTNIMIVVTEASGINQMIFEGIEGCLQGNSKLMLVHNPNNTNGEAYTSMKDIQYKSFRLNSLESQNVALGLKLEGKEISQDYFDKNKIPGQVDLQWVRDHINKMGWTMQVDEKDASKHDFEFDGKIYRPSDVCKIKILGVHPENSDDTLIPLAWIEAANERWKKKNIKPERTAVDIAGLGVDTTVIARKEGNYIDELEVPTIADKSSIHMTITGMLINNKESTVIDIIGEGAGTFSRIKEQEKENFYGFKGSYSAAGLSDITGVRCFVNMRAYCFWMLRQALDPSFNSELELPPDDELKAQLTEIKFKIKSDGKIQIEAKADITRRIGVSIDKADTVSMLFAPISRLAKTYEKKTKINGADFFS